MKNKKLLAQTNLEWFWGMGRPMIQARTRMYHGLERKLPLLILGKRGTGKEIMAHECHAYVRSQTPEQPQSPFIVLKITSETCFDLNDYKSIFKSAEGGTLYIDEIQLFKREDQVNIFEALKNSQKNQTQLVFATSVSLEGCVRRGNFHKEFYEWARVCSVILPELKNRREDFPVLIRGITEFVAKKKSKPILEIESNVYELFLRYPWPGNIRELHKVLEELDT